MTPRTRLTMGYVLAALVALFLIFASALPKIFMPTAIEELSRSIGMWDILLYVGLLELACAVLLLIPRTATVGFVCMVGLLGGAMAVGLTHDNPNVWPWFPGVFLAILMVSAYFRTPELLSRVLNRPVPSRHIAARIIGWILAAPVILIHVFAAYSKFVPSFAGEQGATFAKQVGMAGLETPLGILEILILLLFIIPRTSTIGFILMVGYTGGILAASLTHGFGFIETYPMWILLGLLAISGYLRLPELVSRLEGKPVPQQA